LKLLLQVIKLNYVISNPATQDEKSNISLFIKIPRCPTGSSEWHRNIWKKVKGLRLQCKHRG